MRYWLVEASDRHGAQWGFLVESEHKPVEAFVAGRMKSLGRVIEISGQTVEVSRIDLSTLIVRREATARTHRGVRRYSLEGDKVG